MSEITELLRQANQGDNDAAHQVFKLTYDELRRMAAMKLYGDSAGETLQPTALVHEAYLRLIGKEDFPSFENARHFFGSAAQAMRRVLVDRARAKATQKRSGERLELVMDFNQIGVDIDLRPYEFLALDELLTELELHDPQAAELINLRFFANLTHQQAAETLGITRRVADRLWALARAWLYVRLKQQLTGDA
ncbi:MAG: ECF-type sigma factor [Pirellulaceae bacterium]|nr:ECF-type sigma factor [Pirellulaceae bacterium]